MVGKDAAVGPAGDEEIALVGAEHGIDVEIVIEVDAAALRIMPNSLEVVVISLPCHLSVKCSARSEFVAIYSSKLNSFSTFGHHIHCDRAPQCGAARPHALAARRHAHTIASPAPRPGSTP
jgi:hypothetical protein